MTQRTIAALIAVPLVLGLFVAAGFMRLDYATYMPGPTIDVLGQTDGNETIQVVGQKTYRDTGQLRMVTVNVSPNGEKLSLTTLMGAWLNKSDAVYPYDYVHPDDQSAEEDRQEGAVSMVTSQDVAITDALRALGFTVRAATGVYYVYPDSPADGVLQARDIFLKVDGTSISSPDQLVEAIRDAPEGEKITLLIERAGQQKTVSLTPEIQDGVARIGIQPGTLYRYPFQVSVNIDPNIGGPSAGLMFSLAIYDTLTPGSLTGGKVIAGTGTIDLDGNVGPIGGIQQKIAGAERDGAELFLVPPDNCAEALGVEDGNPRLVRVDTMESALKSIAAWTKDPDADLPSCEDVPAS